MKTSAARRRWGSGTATAFAAVALHGPPQTEVGLGLSGGAYEYRGCSNDLHRARFAEVQAHLRGSRGHIGFAVEGSSMVVRDHVTPEPRSEPLSDFVQWEHTSVAAARLGLHFRYGGLEAGPALAGWNRGTNHIGIFPSARVWAGVPEVVTVWVSLLAQETQALSRFAGIGLGHAQDNLRLSLGVTASPSETETVIADALYQVRPGLWLGGGLAAGGTDNGNRAGTATLRLGLTY